METQSGVRGFASWPLRGPVLRLHADADPWRLLVSRRRVRGCHRAGLQYAQGRARGLEASRERHEPRQQAAAILEEFSRLRHLQLRHHRSHDPRSPAGSVVMPKGGSRIACVLVAWSLRAFALDPALDVDQYAHSSWKYGDGLVSSRVTTIAQTADGYLWLGTEFGLARFDGVRSVTWHPPPGPSLPANFIPSL